MVKLQENPDSIPEGETPATITLMAFDNLVDVARPGDKVEVRLGKGLEMEHVRFPHHLDQLIRRFDLRLHTGDRNLPGPACARQSQQAYAQVALSHRIMWLSDSLFD